MQVLVKNCPNPLTIVFFSSPQLHFIFIAVLFPRHTNKETRDNTINLIHMFRDYLHYHIKVCSKVIFWLTQTLHHPRIPHAECRCYRVRETINFSTLSNSSHLPLLSYSTIVFEGLYSLANARKDFRLPQSTQPSETGAKKYRKENNHVSSLCLCVKKLVYGISLIKFVLVSVAKLSSEGNDWGLRVMLMIQWTRGERLESAESQRENWSCNLNQQHTHHLSRSKRKVGKLFTNFY